MTELGIFGPVGGYANHVRWLALLDSSFRINRLNEVKYNVFRGVSWPSVEEFKLTALESVDPAIIDEMYNTLEDNFIEFSNLESKLRFIERRVYPATRTYHNWLTVEWTYRETLNSIIFFGHQIDELLPVPSKVLLLEVSPEIAYKNYFKFNSRLNNLSKSEFFQACLNVQAENRLKATSLGTSNRILNTDCLYCEVLDYGFYTNLLEIFNLTVDYDVANYVHKLWFVAQRRAESDFVFDSARLYK